MRVHLATNSKNKKPPKRFVKDTNCIGVLAFDTLEAKKGDVLTVKRFFAVEDRHFVNPYMATVRMETGNMKGKTMIIQAFSVTMLLNRSSS